MGWPEWIYLSIVFMALGISMANHGQQKVKEENFFTTLLAVVIQIGLMWWGGFFD